MSNVALSIGGRNFTVACAEGEEAHIGTLGRMIEGKLATMGDLSGQNEVRMLLFAALLMADELHEAKTGASAQAAAPVPPDGAMARLEAIAGQLENLASRLEGQDGIA